MFLGLKAREKHTGLDYWYIMFSATPGTFQKYNAAPHLRFSLSHSSQAVQAHTQALPLQIMFLPYEPGIFCMEILGRWMKHR